MSMITIKKGAPEARSIGELSHLDFGRPAGELGCFLNFKPNRLREPTDAQLAILEGDGVIVPEGVTDIDASTMICRIGAWDVQPGPDSEAVAMAEQLGTQFSAFIGADDLLRRMVEQAAERDRAALYCYGVACAIRGRRFINMFADPDASLFMGFADIVAADPALKKSLADRSPEDYAEPRKGTKIYKAAAAYLAGGGSI